MSRRLLFLIDQKLEEQKTLLVTGHAKDMIQYNVMCTKIDVLTWVKEEIARLEDEEVGDMLEDMAEDAGMSSPFDP